LALLDTSLPGIDWEELGNRIASDPELNRTAMLLMCAFGRDCKWTHMGKRGFAGHVSKPIWGRTLREALLTLAPGATPPVTPARGDGSVRRAATRRSARVLVAEDNATNREVAVAMLKKLGYPFDLAANGKEALQALRTSDFEIVLMDCEMPEMDGYEATRRIRDINTGTRNPRIPIIALTADAVSGDREKCLQAGMNDYLSKPVEPPQLAAILEKWLNDPAGPSAAKPDAGDPEAQPEAVFNPEAFLVRLAGDEPLARKIVAGFLNDLPGRLQSLNGMLEGGDAQGVRLLAHALKGAGATVSAEALRALFLQLQQAAAAGRLSAARVLLPEIEEQITVLKSTLKRLGWA
jgi:CheY-like chemotaxis protein